MLQATETIFQYNGSPIAFQKGDSVMVNATEMAKPFGKTAKDWLRTNASSEFINSLSSVRQICPTELVRITQGGAANQQGTWMHEDVALEFARWLSPAFAIWCNDRIKELLTQGETTLQPLNFDDPDVVLQLATKWSEEKKLRLQAEQKAAIEAEINHQNKPKVAFADAIIASNTSCLIGELAKLITQNGVEIGQNRLFAWMREHGYLGKHGERRNIPNQQYIEQGLFELKKGIRSGNDGVIHTTITPKVTGKGQQYFINKFLSQSPKNA